MASPIKARTSSGSSSESVRYPSVKIPSADGAKTTVPSCGQGWRSSKFSSVFDTMGNSETDQTILDKTLSTTLPCLFTFLGIVSVLIALRILSELAHPDSTEWEFQVSITSEAVGMGIVAVLLSVLCIFDTMQVYTQEILTMAMSAAVLAILVASQIGHNHLLTTWPLHSLLIVLGSISIASPIRRPSAIIVIVSSNIIYISLLLFNNSYSSNPSWAELVSTITFLVAISLIFLNGSFQNKSLRRSEYIFTRQVLAENQTLKARLDKAEKTALRRPVPAINLDSPLEKILHRLNVVLESCTTPSDASLRSTIAQVIQLLGDNSESLLRPDLHLRDAAQGEMAVVKFMSTELTHSEFVNWKRPHFLERTGSSIGAMTYRVMEKKLLVPRKTSVSLDLTCDRSGIAIELATKLLTWNLDFLDINARSNGCAITLLAAALFTEHNFVAELKLDPVTVTNFFDHLQRHYLNVIYHNSAHGADVCHSFYNLLYASNQTQSLQPIELMAALIACLGHDVGHPGYNNAFMINTGSPEALIYNDKAVLENMHVAEIFKIASIPKCNIFHSLTRSQFKTVRGIMIDMILSTDLARHFEILSAFKIKLASMPADLDRTVNWFEKDITMMLRILIKVSDLAHFTKSTTLHLRWNQLVIEEFYRQGDQEREKGLEVSLLMDRRMQDSLGVNQIGFINYIVKPLLDTSSSVFDGFEPIMRHLEDNAEFWRNYHRPDNDKVEDTSYTEKKNGRTKSGEE